MTAADAGPVVSPGRDAAEDVVVHRTPGRWSVRCVGDDRPRVVAFDELVTLVASARASSQWSDALAPAVRSGRPLEPGDVIRDRKSVV